MRESAPMRSTNVSLRRMSARSSETSSPQDSQFLNSVLWVPDELLQRGTPDESSLGNAVDTCLAHQARVGGDVSCTFLGHGTTHLATHIDPLITLRDFTPWMVFHYFKEHSAYANLWCPVLRPPADDGCAVNSLTAQGTTVRETRYTTRMNSGLTETSAIDFILARTLRELCIHVFTRQSATTDEGGNPYDDLDQEEEQEEMCAAGAGTRVTDHGFSHDMLERLDAYLCKVVESRVRTAVENGTLCPKTNVGISRDFLVLSYKEFIETLHYVFALRNTFLTQRGMNVDELETQVTEFLQDVSPTLLKHMNRAILRHRYHVARYQSHAFLFQVALDTTRYHSSSKSPLETEISCNASELRQYCVPLSILRKTLRNYGSYHVADECCVVRALQERLAQGFSLTSGVLSQEEICEFSMFCDVLDSMHIVPGASRLDLISKDLCRTSAENKEGTNLPYIRHESVGNGSEHDRYSVGRVSRLDWNSTSRNASPCFRGSSSRFSYAPVLSSTKGSKAQKSTSIGRMSAPVRLKTAPYFAMSSQDRNGSSETYNRCGSEFRMSSSWRVERHEEDGTVTYIRDGSNRSSVLHESLDALPSPNLHPSLQSKYVSPRRRGLPKPLQEASPKPRSLSRYRGPTPGKVKPKKEYAPQIHSRLSKPQYSKTPSRAFSQISNAPPSDSQLVAILFASKLRRCVGQAMADFMVIDRDHTGCISFYDVKLTLERYAGPLQRLLPQTRDVDSVLWSLIETAGAVKPRAPKNVFGSHSHSVSASLVSSLDALNRTRDIVLYVTLADFLLST